MSQPDGVTQGVDLPLALMKLWLHVGEIVGPFTLSRYPVEGVGVGIDENTSGLAMDDAPDQTLERLVLTDQREIGPDLGCGVPKPHGFDVAGDDERVGLPIYLTEGDGRIEGVGKAVPEQPGNLRIAYVFRHSLQGGLDGL
jgi:hypothetical protein